MHYSLELYGMAIGGANAAVARPSQRHPNSPGPEKRLRLSLAVPCCGAEQVGGSGISSATFLSIPSRARPSRGGRGVQFWAAAGVGEHTPRHAGLGSAAAGRPAYAGAVEVPGGVEAPVGEADRRWWAAALTLAVADNETTEAEICSEM
ncbi:hypothetical protein B2J93_9044 [Marssonina coronariae]|uniref:Uncharacterized protein n=1 Tax=Diplocarpon coronariae TaxID=2795749 RepID=A0A218ZIE3_9HELO|nr:hypothetical protein B2J93_9044 [Marssonina coronariae]